MCYLIAKERDAHGCFASKYELICRFRAKNAVNFV